MGVSLRNLRLLASAAGFAALALAGCSANQQPVDTAVAPSSGACSRNTGVDPAGGGRRSMGLWRLPQ